MVVCKCLRSALVEDNKSRHVRGQYICECFQDINLVIRACSQLVEISIRHDEVVAYIREKSVSRSTSFYF